MSVKVFASLTETADYARRAKAPVSRESSDSFCGGDMETALRLCRNGDLSGVAASDKLLSKFEELAYDTERLVWIDDVCGSIPNVPAFVAGQPLAMRRRVKRSSEYGVIRVVVNLFASWSFSHEDIQRRGAAVLALARILSMRRPVELYVSFMSSLGEKDTAVLTRIDTAPLDLAHAAFAMTSPMFMRRVCFAIAEDMGGGSSFPPLRRGALAEIAAQAFGEGQTILVDGIRNSDAQVVADPQKWIIDRIRETAPEMLSDAA